jgi:GxxExxY protein
MDLLHKDITDKIIMSFYKVYNELGFGFLEKVYQNALFLELVGLSVFCEKQKQIKVVYNGLTGGEYFAEVQKKNLYK